MLIRALILFGDVSNVGAFLAIQTIVAGAGGSLVAFTRLTWRRESDLGTT